MRVAMSGRVQKDMKAWVSIGKQGSVGKHRSVWKCVKECESAWKHVVVCGSVWKHVEACGSMGKRAEACGGV